MKEEMRQIRFDVWGKADKKEIIEKLIQLEDEIYALQTVTIDELIHRMIQDAIDFNR